VFRQRAVAVAAGGAMILSGNLSFAKKRYLGWMDVWGLNTVWDVLAESLCELVEK
jgi:hypothetical protein